MLRNLLRENSQISSMYDLLNSFNERSERSKATKLWSDNLIKGLFTMTAFGRGANEQDFPLQLAAVKAVLVTATLFGRGWMTELPGTLFLLVVHPLHGVAPYESLEELNNHDCGICLIPGLNNSILTDQLIESTYMRLGHEPGRATCLVVKCPDYEQLGTQLHRLWRGKFQPRQNVRECAPDSHMPKGREFPTNIHM